MKSSEQPGTPGDRTSPSALPSPDSALRTPHSAVDAPGALPGRGCPVCGAAEGPGWLQKADLRLARCARCSMVYAAPVPAAFASGRYYEQVGTEYYLSAAKLEGDYAPERFERELRLFRKHCRRGRVLDVGCSSGAFLFHLKGRFPGDYEVFGTDVSGAPLDYAESRGIPVVRGDFPGQDFGGRQFEAVSFWAVLEHLAEPRSFLERAWPALKPDGVCFVLVPNLRSLAMRLLGARWRYVYPQHLNYFTQATLRRLVEERFFVVETRFMHFNPVVIWQDWRRRGAEVSNVERAALLKRTSAWKQNRWLKPLKGLYRLAELALGTFGLADNVAMVLRKKPGGTANLLTE
ncbi:MAG TPA: class I SAM-dependent methyltransferase [Dongiaceae bacterium]|nr:class I SAM-dependent methyltransferase [Dongiaceae bacterium]